MISASCKLFDSLKAPRLETKLHFESEDGEKQYMAHSIGVFFIAKCLIWDIKLHISTPFGLLLVGYRNLSRSVVMGLKLPAGERLFGVKEQSGRVKI